MKKYFYRTKRDKSGKSRNGAKKGGRRKSKGGIVSHLFPISTSYFLFLIWYFK